MLTSSLWWSRLTSLRLEADEDSVYDRDDMIGGISSLVSLETLCLSGFQHLGDWPAEVAAALRPLHHLRALVGGPLPGSPDMQRLCSVCMATILPQCHNKHWVVDPMLQGLGYCNLRENPATGILTRLTLLSLRCNNLKNLPDALPAGTVHNIRLLDISYNAQLFQQRNSKTWAAEDIAAFDSGWASLQVLGIERESTDSGLRATAKLLQRQLQRQADAAEPRRLPATVVYDYRHHYELLRPARFLAEISD